MNDTPPIENMAPITSRFISNPIQLIQPSFYAFISGSRTYLLGVCAYFGIAIGAFVVVVLATIIANVLGANSGVAALVAGGLILLIALFGVIRYIAPAIVILSLAMARHRSITLRQLLQVDRSTAWRLFKTQFLIVVITIVPLLIGLGLFVGAVLASQHNIVTFIKSTGSLTLSSLSIGLMITGGVIIVISFILLAIYGTYFSLAQFVVIEEGLGGRLALARSYHLIRGRYWEAAALLALPQFLSGLSLIPFVGSFALVVISVFILPASAIRFLQLRELRDQQPPVVKRVSHWNYLVAIGGVIMIGIVQLVNGYQAYTMSKKAYDQVKTKSTVMVPYRSNRG